MAHFATSPTNSTIRKLLERFDITNPLNAWPPPQHAIAADKLVLVCKAPPIHPALWGRARELLGIQRQHVGDKIAWATRNQQNSAHGRIALNEDEVQAYLANRFSDRFVAFDSDKFSLDETIRLFQQARVLGIHGGGLYNGLFAPATAAIAEFMPTDRNGSAQGASDKIFWRISAILQQDYWRVNAVVDYSSASAVDAAAFLST
jgi:capsular polysaccharide biosynthesis protein